MQVIQARVWVAALIAFAQCHLAFSASPDLEHQTEFSCSSATVTVDDSSAALEPECAICLQPLESHEIDVLKCGHVFHGQCLRSWIDTKISQSEANWPCPKCRATYNCHFITRIEIVRAAANSFEGQRVAVERTPPISRITRFIWCCCCMPVVDD